MILTGSANIYLIGSLENPEIPTIANQLRAAGYNVFDDWFAAGPDADKKWREYEERRGRSYKQALKGEAARNVFNFDKTHLEQSDIAVLAMPAGRSGHLELGWMLGRGKPGYILLDSNPEEAKKKWDVMSLFATDVATGIEELLEIIRRDHYGEIVSRL